MARMRTVFRLNPLDHPFEADGTGTDSLAGGVIQQPGCRPGATLGGAAQVQEERTGRMARLDGADGEGDAVQDHGQFFIEIMRGRRGNGADSVCSC